MAEKVAQSRIRASVTQALSSFIHPSLVLVGVVAAGFTYLANAMVGNRDIATPVFLISGTLVALILPAASLSAQYVEPRLSYWTAELIKPGAELPAIATKGRGEITAMESVVAPLWRGFMFVLISFPLSATALFRPEIQIGSVTGEVLLVGISLGFLIVAVFSFLPFIWEILQLDVVRETRIKLFAPDVVTPANTGMGTEPLPGDSDRGASTPSDTTTPTH